MKVKKLSQACFFIMNVIYVFFFKFLRYAMCIQLLSYLFNTVVVDYNV